MLVTSSMLLDVAEVPRECPAKKDQVHPTCTSRSLHEDSDSDINLNAMSGQDG